MKCLINKSIQGYLYLANQYNLEEWTIKNQSISDRYKIMKNSQIINYLTELADRKEIKYDHRETISWIDNISILSRALEGILYDIQVIAEYHIPFSNNRIDYLLVCGQKILVIEFSFANKLSQKERYQNKLNQVICYKELLSAILPDYIKIDTYTFIITPEVDEDWNQIQENYLNDMIKNLHNFIKHYFKDPKSLALELLEEFE